MRKYLPPFLGFATVTSAGLWLLSIVAGVCASTGNQAAARISEEATFTWPIVAMIVIAAGGYAATITTMRLHMKDSVIHRTNEDNDERYRRKDECNLIHKKPEQ